jgi:hypothetical protein
MTRAAIAFIACCLIAVVMFVATVVMGDPHDS